MNVDLALTPSVDRLGHQAAMELFGSGRHVVPVRLRRAPTPRMIWLNQRAMTSDPAFRALGGDIGAYQAHLLAACAYVVPEPGQPADADPDVQGVTGYADRYGGAGIGTNGGSGRTALVNGYLVKGVGKTPLIGINANSEHSTGGAYLEECVRETIFSEIVEAEFPASAIPTLAIIDSGIVQLWEGDFISSSERRVLIVRPCMLRPAHFERALGFLSSNPKEGAHDFARVQNTFDSAAALYGAQQLGAQLGRFLSAWAQQLAYAYVHRLSSSGNSTSNICFDGKLLDFGACSSLPSWAQIIMVHGSPPAGSEFDTLVQSAQSLSYFFGRCHQAEMGQPPYLGKVLVAAHGVYLRTLAVEVLRVCGVTRRSALGAVDGTLQERVYEVVRRLLARFRKEHFDITDFTPSPVIVWDIADVWLEQPPAHLKELRGLLDALVVDAAPGETRRRCQFVSRTRYSLFREEMKYRLLPLINRAAQPDQDVQNAVTNIICRAVAAGRRDVREEPDNAVPIGFAVAPQFSLALYACGRSGAQFAVIEWETEGYFAALASGAEGLYSTQRLDCLAVRAWNEDGVILGTRFAVHAPCALSTWECAQA